MLVEEQKIIWKKIIANSEKSMTNGAGGLAALLLCIDRKFTGIFCKDPDVISVAYQIIHITFLF